MKIADLVGHSVDPRTFDASDKLPDNSFVGLEIELEGLAKLNKAKFNHPLWHISEDGSLRDNGREFKFRYPLRGADLISALEGFEDFIKSYKEKYEEPSCSERTSIHVHIDVREMSVDELNNFFLLYLTFEPAFFHVFGKGREDNNYCLPTFKADSFTKSFSHLSSGGKKARNSFNTGKYAAFNTTSIEQRGSVEIRLHEGTDDVSRIYTWIYILLCLKSLAKSMEFPYYNLPTHISEIGPLMFIQNVFQNEADLFTYKGFQLDIFKGLRYAQDVINEKDFRKNSAKLISVSVDNRDLITAYASKHGIEMKEVEIDALIVADEMFSSSNMPTNF